MIVVIFHLKVSLQIALLYQFAKIATHFNFTKLKQMDYKYDIRTKY